MRSGWAVRLWDEAMMRSIGGTRSSNEWYGCVSTISVIWFKHMGGIGSTGSCKTHHEAGNSSAVCFTSCEWASRSKIKPFFKKWRFWITFYHFRFFYQPFLIFVPKVLQRVKISSNWIFNIFLFEIKCFIYLLFRLTYCFLYNWRYLIIFFYDWL